jgi:ligand-binding SRPBCC domain-containing protein
MTLSEWRDMREYRLERSQWIGRPIEEVFAFFGDAGNLQAITPPWLHFEIVTPRPITMRAGTLVEYRLRWRVVPIRWLTEIVEWNPPHQFVDQQRRGPYALWHHTHTFESEPGGTRMHDVVRYALPLGLFGAIAHRMKVQKDLNAIFDYRARVISSLLGG